MNCPIKKREITDHKTMKLIWKHFFIMNSHRNKDSFSKNKKLFAAYENQKKYCISFI